MKSLHIYKGCIIRFCIDMNSMAITSNCTTSYCSKSIKNLKRNQRTFCKCLYKQPPSMHTYRSHVEHTQREVRRVSPSLTN